MRFCDECGSMMHAEEDAWRCSSCGYEEPRDMEAEAEMTTQEGQRDDNEPVVVDATQDSDERVEEPCPADGCDSTCAEYEMMPKPGGSYEVRLFTCVECGHKWRD